MAYFRAGLLLRARGHGSWSGLGYGARNLERHDYKDDYNENLMRVIKSKMKGTAPRLRSSDAPVPANVVDLMARLKESLAQRSPARSAKRKPAAARGRKRTKKVA